MENKKEMLLGFLKKDYNVVKMNYLDFRYAIDPYIDRGATEIVAKQLAHYVCGLSTITQTRIQASISDFFIIDNILYIFCGAPGNIIGYRGETIDEMKKVLNVDAIELIEDIISPRSLLLNAVHDYYENKWA